ncbi:MAG: hypothetical protein EB168_09800, partial [Euryarchaeota archaeon]|nr:hypothetical protein [Euryarchaeota archaeon]
MANFLLDGNNFVAGVQVGQAVNATGDPVVQAAISGLSTQGFIGDELRERNSRFLLGNINGPGSKPNALHTEYASGAAEWPKPYGSQDIVFYLMRADMGTPASANTPASAGTGTLPSPVGG